MKKVMIIIVALLVVIGIVVKVFVLKPEFRYAGTLEATKVDLSTRLAATIDTVNVQEGDRVKKDQELIEMSCEDFKIAARLATENFDRSNRLYRVGSSTKETRDQDINHKQDADTRLSWCQIKSPIEGKVMSRYHEPGEWANTGTKILTLANIKDIWAYVYIPQPLISKLFAGAKVTGFLPEEKNRSFQGTVVKINDEAEFTPKNVQTQSERERLVFGVKISFAESNNDEVLKPGMTIEVEMPH